MNGFEWPVYRGAQCQFPQLLITAPRWENEFANTISFAGNTLEVSQQPLANERKAQTLTRRFEGIYYLRAARVSAYNYAVVLADARYALSCINPATTYNVLKGDGTGEYVRRTARSDSAPATLGDMLNDYAAALGADGYQTAFDAGSFASLPIPDNTLTDGVPMWQALSMTLEDLGLDLYVADDGTITIIQPTDNIDVIRNASSAVDWLESAPPVVFDPDALTYANQPLEVRAHYYEQREIAASYVSGETLSIDTSRPDPYLEQVYLYRGQWRNVEECKTALNALGLPSAAWPSEGEIQRYYFSDVWPNANIGRYQTQADDSLLANNQRKIAEDVIRAVRESWRTAFRVVYPDGFGPADTPNLVPGRFNELGEVTNQAVECQWVDVLNHPTLINGRYETGRSRYDQQYQFGDAPFEVQWDASSRVIRLAPSGSTTEVRARVPGSLDTQLTLRTYSLAELKAANVDAITGVALPDSLIVPATANARFSPVVRVRVRMIYTRRVVSDRSHYRTVIEDNASADGAERPIVDLPVPEAPTARYLLNDQTTPVNLSELQADAERRTAALLLPYKAPAVATAESPGLNLLAQLQTLPDGVSSYAIVAGSRGPEYMGVRIQMQDLERIASLRMAQAGRRPSIIVNGVQT